MIHKTRNLLILMTAIIGIGFFSFDQYSIYSQQDDKKQIFISPQNIIRVNDTGAYNEFAYNDPTTKQYVRDYRAYYNPYHMIDNMTNSYSFWSQKGDSTFKFELASPIKNICSIDIGVYDPLLKTPFKLTISNMTVFKEVSGILDQPKTTAEIPQCINNVTMIDAQFTPDDKTKFTLISELSFFSKDVVVSPPIDPPECKDNEHIEDNKCVPNAPTNQTGVVTNSNVTIKISNSSVLFSADNSSKIVFPNITLPQEPIPIPPACTPDSFWNGTHCTPAVTEANDSNEDDDDNEENNNDNDDNNNVEDEN